MSYSVIKLVWILCWIIITQFFIKLSAHQCMLIVNWWAECWLWIDGLNADSVQSNVCALCQMPLKGLLLRSADAQIFFTFSLIYLICGFHIFSWISIWSLILRFFFSNMIYTFRWWSLVIILFEIYSWSSCLHLHWLYAFKAYMLSES